MTTDVRKILNQHLAYCRASNWAGYEPYDALDSPILKASGLLASRHARIAFTQALKRCPVNFRRLLCIPQKQNPKPLSVFLSSFVKLERNGEGEFGAEIDYLIERLRTLRSPGEARWAWGYSFPWQTRTKLVPAYTANLVGTSFVANALLDAYEWRGDARLLEMGASAAEYLLETLYWTGTGDAAGFAYPLPSIRHQVHNANFLASALLCRVARLTGETKFVEPALRATRHSASKQLADGSWLYGEASTQTWIDNFHTGYNLCGLRDVARYADTDEFDECIRRGFAFWRQHFFEADGSIRYFHDHAYPVDTHCVAQVLITLAALQDLDRENLPLARSVLDWTVRHMWDERGYFYYQVDRYWKIRISYMRWTQAWMFLGMTTLLCAEKEAQLRSEKSAQALQEV